MTDRKPTGQKADIRYWVKGYYQKINKDYRSFTKEAPDFLLTDLVEFVKNNEEFMANWREFMQGNKNSRPTLFWNPTMKRGLEFLGIGTIGQWHAKKKMDKFLNKEYIEYGSDEKYFIKNIKEVNGEMIFSMEPYDKNCGIAVEVNEDLLLRDFEEVKD